MKNCGQTIHDEVASKQTMEELKDLLKVTFILFVSFFIFIFFYPFGQFPIFCTQSHSFPKLL